MSPEHLIPVALFVAVVLFNLLARWLRSRMQQQEQQQPPGPPRAEPVPPPPRARVLRPPRPPAAEEQLPVRRAQARVVRREGPRLLGTPRDLRRAIVLMAVLEAPRGFQPDRPDGMR